MAMANLIPQVTGLQVSSANVTYLFAATAILGLFVWYLNRQKLPDVPILSISTLPGAAGAAADVASFVADGSKVMQIGYERYSKKGQSYLLRTPTQLVFVAAPRLIEEIRSSKDADLNPLPANNVIMQLRHTLHAHLEVDQYHFGVVQKQLTQNLGPGLPAIVEEGKLAWAEELGKPKEWQEVSMWDTSFRVVTRTANKLLFGGQLSSNPEFLRLSIDYSFVMFGGADLVRSYPSFLKPFIMYFRTPLRQEQAKAKKHLLPIIKERIAEMQRYEQEGRMDEYEKIKATDSIQWVLDITPPEKRDPQMLVWRMLHIDISAVHTSSVTFIDCVNELAACPEIHDELRQEIRDVFAAEGGQWRKQGLTKLVKMDSFMRETVRFNPLFAGQLDRVAVRDIELSDGTKIPKGTYLTVPSFAMYMDNEYYEDASTFDPFRFSKKRQVAGQETLHSFVQTTPSFLHFGHGKHACPGRFFAANEIKVLLVLALMNYDIALVEGETRPAPPLWFSKGRSPNPSAKLRWKYRGGADEAFLV